MKQKICGQCGSFYSKRYTEPKLMWDGRKYCSRQCVWDAKKGKKHSPEHIEKLRLTSTGRRHTPEAIAKLKGENCHLWRGGKPKCIDCGKPVTNIYAKRCFPCYAKQASGENASNWKGGITPANAKIRNSKLTVEWRKAVFERDNHTCQMCKARGGLLHAHHVKPFAKHPEFRFDIDNGQTLCKPCHKAVHSRAYVKQNAVIEAVTA
jgi:hypothetical protein